MAAPIRSRFLTVQPIDELALPFPVFSLPLAYVPAGTSAPRIEPPQIVVLSVYAPEVSSSSFTIFTPPNPTTTRLWEPVVIREQFVGTNLLAQTAIHSPAVMLAVLQTVYPNRFPYRSPYYITAVVHEPRVGTKGESTAASTVYLYLNLEVNQDNPSDIGASFVYLWANSGLQRPGTEGDISWLYLYVNPVWFVKMPMIFLLSTAQPLDPGSGLSGWGILPIAIQEYD